MKVSQPTPITEGLFQLRVFGARVTVLVENGEALLVDAGLPGSLGAITRGLEVCGASLDQIGRTSSRARRRPRVRCESACLR